MEQEDDQAHNVEKKMRKEMNEGCPSKGSFVTPTFLFS